MMTRWMVVASAALAFVSLARAELPGTQLIERIEPREREIFPNPRQLPQTPYFGAAVALEHDIALAGMPGAFNLEGRVAVLRRNATGQWVRTGTLQAGDRAPLAQFGAHVALFERRALVASTNSIYLFELASGSWRQTHRWLFSKLTQISDIAWQGDLIAVGVGGLGGRNGVHVFSSADRRLRHIAKLLAHDTMRADRFGSRVAVSTGTLAITAPGYNANQGAVYLFACTATQCAERRKLLANDGARGDQFGDAVDLRGNVLVVGATGVDLIPGDAGRAPGERNFRAGGAAYLFMRSRGEWVELEKLRPSARESNWYWDFGSEVAIADRRVLIGAPYGLEEYEPGLVFVYEWSGSSLVATRMLIDEPSHGSTIAAHGSTVLVGTPYAPPYSGWAGMYLLGGPAAR